MRAAAIASSVLSSIVLGVLCFTLNACRDTRQLTYFENKLDFTAVQNLTVPEPVIQRGDLLSIVVYSDNPDATQIFNQVSSGAGKTEKGTTVSAGVGYEVDVEGNILFQGIGPLKVEGLTKKGLVALLDSRLKDTFLKNPYYSIRFLNMKISVLGEVKQPGTISLPAEQINIFEALSLSGDFTDFAQRDSVLIIREHAQRREIIPVDLSKTDILRSPNYYLNHNDILLVRAIKRKSTATDLVTARNISLAVSIVSASAIIINTLFYLTR